MAVQLAGCIITDDQGRILLLHRNTEQLQQWEVPGGKLDPDEDPEATAIREVKEELGIDVEITQKLGQRVFTQGDREFDYTWFQAHIISGQPQVIEPETFDDLRYLSREDMSHEKLSAGAQKFLSMLEGDG